MNEFNPNILANKLLDIILAEYKLMEMLLRGDWEASQSSLESLLASLTMVASRVSMTHLTKLMSDGVPMKQVMEASDDITMAVSEMFQESFHKDLLDSVKEFDTENPGTKPTSH